MLIIACSQCFQNKADLFTYYPYIEQAILKLMMGNKKKANYLTNMSDEHLID